MNTPKTKAEIVRVRNALRPKYCFFYSAEGVPLVKNKYKLFILLRPQYGIFMAVERDKNDSNQSNRQLHHG